MILFGETGKKGATAGLISGLCIGILIIILNASYFNNFLCLWLFSVVVVASYLLVGYLSGLIIDSIIVIARRSRNSREEKIAKTDSGLIVAGITGIVYSLVSIIHIFYYRNLLVPACVFTLALIFGIILISSTVVLIFYFTQKPKRLTVKFFLIFLFAVFLTGLMLVKIYPYRDNKVQSTSLIDTNGKIKCKNTDLRILMIGIDSATWTIMMPMIEKGELPSIKGLMDDGAYGALKTFIPTSTPIIWTSVATGKRPTGHEILDFVSFEVFGVVNCLKLLPKNPDFMWLKMLYGKLGLIQPVPVTSGLRNCEALWNIVQRCDRQAGIINWPVSFPAEPVNGFMVSDRFFHSAEARNLPGAFYPASVSVDMAKLVNEIDLRKLELDRFILPGPEEKHTSPFACGINHSEYLKKFLTEDELTVNSALYFYKREKPDLMAVYFEGLDPIQHLFWMYSKPELFDSVSQKDIDRYGKCIEEYYKYMDEVIERFLSLIDFDVIVFLSDHGMEATSARKRLWKRVSGKQVRSGSHDKAPDGIFIISGKNIRKNTKLNPVTPFDITPTILTLMGLPVAEDMEGRVIKEVLDENFLKNHPIDTVISYDKAEGKGAEGVKTPVDDEIRKRLRTLGYIQ